MKLLSSIILLLAFVAVCGLVLTGATCDEEVNTGASTKVEMEETEANHQRLVKSVPPPALLTSLERIQLKKRLILFNNEKKISYIYLISYGKVMAFYTIKGKVSSVNSKLTTQQQIIDDGGYRSNGRQTRHIVESPSLDGSYGTNGNAVFFFTQGGAYVEWNGEYLLADQPLKITTPPSLVRTITDK